MITVSGFWFGVLMTIVGEIVLVLIIGLLKAAFGRDEQPNIKELNLPPELQEMIAKEIVKQEGRNDKDH